MPERENLFRAWPTDRRSTRHTLYFCCHVLLAEYLVPASNVSGNRCSLITPHCSSIEQLHGNVDHRHHFLAAPSGQYPPRHYNWPLGRERLPRLQKRRRGLGTAQPRETTELVR